MTRFTLNTFTFLGLLLGAMTIVSLVQRIAGVGLAPLLGEVLEYYRWFLGVVKQYGFDWWTLRFLDFSIPLWAMDLISLWGLAIAGNLRVARTQANLAQNVEDIRIENSMDTALRRGALEGLYGRTKYFLIRQIVFAPFEYMIRPFRRFIRIWKMAREAPHLRKAIRAPSNDDSREVIRNTIRFERRLIFVQILPLFGALTFFAVNALVLSPQ